MRRLLSVSILFCLALTAPYPAIAQSVPIPGELQVSADTLGAVILGQNVRLMLHDGAYVEGKILKASRDDIWVQVRRSEPKERSGREKNYRTADIAVVYMQKNGSVAAPVALGVVGGFLGALGAAYGARNVYSSTVYFSVFLTATAAGAAGGAVLGRAAARKTVTINVVPSNR